MSAFTDCNGPCGSNVNLLALYEKLNQLEQQIADLSSKNNSLEDILTTGPISVEKEISSETKVSAPEGSFESLRCGDVTSTGAGSFTGDVSGASGKFTGDVSGANGSFTGDVSGVKGTFSGDVSGANGSFSGSLDVGDSLKSKSLETGDINAGNIDMGLRLNFDKYEKTSVICGHYYVLARTRTLELDPQVPFTEKPAIAFVTSPVDPHIKLLVQFTTKGLSCVYTKREEGDTNTFVDHTDASGKQWPGLALGLYKDNGSNHVYLVLYGYVQGLNGTNFLGSSQFCVSTINCDPVTDNPSIQPDNELALIALPEDGGFTASNMSFRDITISGELNVARLIADEATVNTLHVNNESTFDGDASFNSEASFNSGITVAGASSFKDDVDFDSNITVSKNITSEGTVTGVSGSFDSLDSTNVNGVKASFTDLSVENNATVKGDLTAGGTISSENISCSNTVSANAVATDTLNAENGNITKLDAVDLVADDISATNADIRDASFGTQHTENDAVFDGPVTFNDSVNLNDAITVDSINANTGTFNELTAANAAITKAAIEELNVSGSSVFDGPVDFTESLNVDNGLNVTNGMTVDSITGNDGVFDTLVVNERTELHKQTVIDGETSVTGNTSISGETSVSGETSFSGDTSLSGTTNLTGDTNIDGNTNITGDSLSVKAPADFDYITVSSFKATNALVDDTLTVNKIVSKDGKNIASQEGAELQLGSNETSLTLNSLVRPTISENNTTKKIAYLSDITSSVVYQGQVAFFVKSDDINELPTGPVPHTSIVEYAPQQGDVALFSSGTDKPLHRAVFNGTSWEATADVDIPLELAYEYSIKYQNVDGSDYWVAANLIWAPNSELPPYVTIIELPIENFYTKQEIDNLLTLFVNHPKYTEDQVDSDGVVFALEGQYPTQANWLDERTEIPAVLPYTGNVPNPAYINNKPVTGISILDGGSWEDGVVAPIWDNLVDGGDFTNIVEQTEESLIEKIGSGRTYPNTISIITHGPKESMFAASMNTQYMLKYCEDTCELFIDSGNPTLPDDDYHYRGNILLCAFNKDIAGTTYVTNVYLTLGEHDDTSLPGRKTGLVLNVVTLDGETFTENLFSVRGVACEGDSANRISFDKISDTEWSVCIYVNDIIESIKACVKYSDIQNDLKGGSGEANRVLSASMGRVINNFANRSHFINSTVEHTNIPAASVRLWTDIIVTTDTQDFSSISFQLGNPEVIVGDTIYLSPCDVTGITAVGKVIAVLTDNRIRFRIIALPKYTEVVDSLTSDRSDAALSAKQGLLLNTMIEDALNGLSTYAGMCVGYLWKWNTSNTYCVTSIPSGYKACDGTSLVKADFSELYSALCTLSSDGKCPYGEDADSFVLPTIDNMIISVKTVTGGNVPYDPQGVTVTDAYGVKVIDDLTSDSSTDCLSANMGRILNEKVSLLNGTSTVLVGSLAGYIGSDTPKGYLKCDGQKISKTTYSDLYNIFVALGDNGECPYGEDAQTFTLPYIDNMIIASGV